MMAGLHLLFIHCFVVTFAAGKLLGLPAGTSHHVVAGGFSEESGTFLDPDARGYHGLEDILHRRLRVKRRIKAGDGHIISAFNKVPGMALDVALEIISDVTARDCAVRCVNTQCGAWSHNQRDQKCRLGCVRFPGLEDRCKYVAVPVIAPGWDFYEISAKKLGQALGIIIFSGAAQHRIDIQPSQIRRLEDPLAPENVIRPAETHSPDTTGNPSTAEPATVAPPITPTVSPPGQTPSPPPATDPTPPPPTQSPPVVTPPRPLIRQFDGFPEECGVRPTFGLSDNVRKLSPRQPANRIVGGGEVAAGTYPWQAQIRVAGPGGYNHSCGAIIIADTLMLTAAHCDSKFIRYYEINVAQHDLFSRDDPSQQSYAVENIFRHSGYRPDVSRGQRNDIAIFRIKFQRNSPIQSLQWDEYIQPVCLPTINTTLRVGQECQISGWGVLTANSRTAAPVLRGAVVSILDPRLCYKAYGSRFDHNLMICAGREGGGVDTCQGDSGGPLSCRDQTGQWFVAGVVSFGWGCGEPGHPGVYTRVTAYLEFIHRTAAVLTGNF